MIEIFQSYLLKRSKKPTSQGVHLSGKKTYKSQGKISTCIKIFEMTISRIYKILVLELIIFMVLRIWKRAKELTGQNRYKTWLVAKPEIIYSNWKANAIELRWIANLYFKLSLTQWKIWLESIRIHLKSLKILKIWRLP